jgi:hypothetical protein
MKKIIFLMVSLLFVISTQPVHAGVDVNISIGIPAPLVFTAPPDVVVVPSGPAYVYMVPGWPGIYFYNNFWYRFYGGHWYWAHTYDGRWSYIETHLVPRYVIDVPPDYYRHLPPRYYRIRYVDLHRHWYGWDKSRYWNRYDWYKREYREHERRRHAGDFYREGHKPPPHNYRELKQDRRDQKKGRGGQKIHPDDRKGKKGRR